MITQTAHAPGIPILTTTGATRMRRILLEFIGGAWDGMNLCNDSPDPIEAGLALHTYCQARNGRVGQTVVMPADYALRPAGPGGCKYVVAHRTVFGEEVLLRLEVCWNEKAEGCACAAKRVVLQFEGGDWHGRSLDSGSPDTHEALLAAAYYCLTDQGKVGRSCDGRPIARWFRQRAADPGRSDFAEDCRYHVVQRAEDDQRIVVKFEYRTDDPRSDRRRP